MKRVFHYTVMQRYQNICIDDEIKVAIANVPKGVKPVVWFTTNPDWEETANKPVALDDGSLGELLNRQGMWENGFIPIRIEVDPKKVSLRSWNNYKKNSGDSEINLIGLARTARNPKQWLVSYENVPMDAVIGVSSWDGEKWKAWRKAD